MVHGEQMRPKGMQQGDGTEAGGRRAEHVLTWVSEVLHLPSVPGEVPCSGRSLIPGDRGVVIGEGVLGTLKIPSLPGEPHFQHT